MTNDWQRLAGKALAGERLDLTEGLAVLRAPDVETLPLLQAAFQVRRHYFGVEMRLNMLLNMQSGHCSEDCAYCSQSRRSQAVIDKYPLVARATILAAAAEAIRRQASTFCMVASGHHPAPKNLDEILGAVQEVRAQHPGLRLCLCLGQLTEAQAARVRAAGVERYNHNINTTEAHYRQICSTHSYQERVATVLRLKEAGLSPCCGAILGMGESHEDIVEIAWNLRALGVGSVPVNFLNPIPGTPLEHTDYLTPHFCLRALALFRFVCPDREIRAAGGRERNLRSLQPLMLYAVNSLFVGDYLTTPGQSVADDLRMIADMGFTIAQRPEGEE